MLLLLLQFSELLRLKIVDFKWSVVINSPVSPFLGILGSLTFIEAYQDCPSLGKLDLPRLNTNLRLEESLDFFCWCPKSKTFDMKAEVLHGLLEAKGLSTDLHLSLLLCQSFTDIKTRARGVRVLSFESSLSISWVLKADESETLGLLILISHYDRTGNLSILAEDLIHVFLTEVSLWEVLHIEVSECSATLPGRSCRRLLLLRLILSDTQYLSVWQLVTIHL